MERQALTIKGLHFVAKKRPGKPVRHYVYAWRGGPLIMTKVGGERPALDAAALAAFQSALTDRSTLPPGTLSALAGTWRASAHWKGLAKATRASWAPTLSTIEAKWGTVPLGVFEDRQMKGKIIAWRDTMASHPRSADLHMQVLSSLLSQGVLRGELKDNIAMGIPGLYKGGKRAHIIWEAHEVEAWQKSESQAMRDVVNLARFTGLRRTDLAAIPRTAIKRHAIVWQTSKSGDTVTISVPILPELRTLLDELATRPRAKGVETLLVNSFGQAWTPGGITSSFTTERTRLELPKKHLHDFRGTFATELCLAGETDETIANIVGWSSKEVATIRRLYVDQAATVVAMGERLANRSVNQGVNHSGK